MSPEDVRFLLYRDVVALHDEAVRRFGGPAGLLNPDQLASAAAAPVMVLAALAFLQVNGQTLPDAIDPVLRDLVFEIAAGQCGRHELAQALRRLMTH